MIDLVLFDMDGTLTPARKSAPFEVGEALTELRKYADVGIVTGSGYRYVLEQCGVILRNSSADVPGKFWILPCNGTQLYSWCDTFHKATLLAKNDMKNELGVRELSKVKSILSTIQSDMMKDIGDLPYTSHFIDDRESMINWCPIGRNAGDLERRHFIDFDKKFDFRELTIKKIKDQLDQLALETNLTIKLGGDTSVDIFPEGWDKTFALKHFPGKRVWFVGDRCTGSGNDREIFENLSQHSRAFSTRDPDNTIKIINENIIPSLLKEMYII